MTRARRRLWDYDPPRGLTAGEAAHMLGISETHFKTILPKLNAAGFPREDPITGRRDKRAIDLWLDRRNGIPSTFSTESGDDDNGLGDRLDRWAESGCGIS